LLRFISFRTYDKGSLPESRIIFLTDSTSLACCVLNAEKETVTVTQWLPAMENVLLTSTHNLPRSLAQR
jgi:hypothetical protein